MSGLNEFFMFAGIFIGAVVGGSVAVWATAVTGCLGEIYNEWHDGLQLAQLVKEKKHTRRAELLAKMIELQRAMQPASPLIEGPGQLVNESAGCSDSGEKSCDTLMHTI
jgi:hypothetical protein